MCLVHQSSSALWLSVRISCDKSCFLKHNTWLAFLLMISKISRTLVDLHNMERSSTQFMKTAVRQWVAFSSAKKDLIFTRVADIPAQLAGWSVVMVRTGRCSTQLQTKAKAQSILVQVRCTILSIPLRPSLSPSFSHHSLSLLLSFTFSPTFSIPIFFLSLSPSCSCSFPHPILSILRFSLHTLF